MAVVIGSARQDENGKYVNGKRGDQKQTASPDYKGEVSRQNFYVHSKGWYVLRPKNPVDAMKIAQAMARACDNKHIGYSQSDRLSIVNYGTATTTDCNADCSSLVRTCVKEGTNKDAGNFTTANEVAKLMATGLFEKYEYKNGFTLLDGDVLVTKTKGHTVIVIQGDKKSVAEVAKEVVAGKWGNGIDRKNRLHAAGYDYAEVQAEVNRLLQPKEIPAQHIDQKGIDFLKRFEGCRLTAYKLKGERYYTIGYAHNGADVLPNMTISQERADELFRLDLVTTEKFVKRYATDIVLTQNRLNALVSYAYNRGVGKFRDELVAQSHTVQEYADNIVRLWGSNQNYKDALIRRRKAERELFLS